MDTTATWKELHSFGLLAMSAAYAMGLLATIIAFKAGIYRRKWLKLKQKYNDPD